MHVHSLPIRLLVLLPVLSCVRPTHEDRKRPGDSTAPPDTSADSPADSDSTPDSDSKPDSTTDSDTAADTDSDEEMRILELESVGAKLLGEPTSMACHRHWITMSAHGGGDSDGDGLPDVLIGFPCYEVSTVMTGAAYLVSGPISGRRSLSEATAKFTAENPWDAAGFSVAFAGDTNGDGQDDLIIGAPLVDDVGEGAAYVVLGPVVGEHSLADADAKLGGVTTSPGYYYYYYEAMLGYAVSGAGDTDGDGLSDVLVGAPDYRDVSTDGVAFLVRGPISGQLDLSVDAEARIEKGSSFVGCRFSAAGDVNGDGLGDFLVGSMWRASLFLGPVAGTLRVDTADAVYDSNDASDWFGGALSRAGDVDGDGLEDLLFGVPNHRDVEHGDYPGAAYLVLGPEPGRFMIQDVAWRLEGVESEQAGSVAAAGDVDGDGFGDIMVGAPSLHSDDWTRQPGGVYVVFGPVLGNMSLGESDYRLDGDGNDLAGYRLSSAGDMDGDGLGDLLIGSLGDDEGGESTGAAWLVHGASLTRKW
jgi:hypothetical protein